MTAPRTLAARIEQQVALPVNPAERFSGYAVMALPFRSGHVLALRRWPVTSIGPGHTSVWHRAPDGAWRFYADVAPELSCPRYFGSAASATVHTPVEVGWVGDRSLHVHVPRIGLDWRMTIASSAVTGALNAMSALVPEPLWQQRRFLGIMGRMAGPLLGAGRIRLHGRLPNGQWFLANPRLIWTIGRCEAGLGGQDLGPAGPLPRQTHLADFWIPQRGIFCIATAFLEPYDARRHAPLPFDDTRTDKPCAGVEVPVSGRARG